MGTKIYDVPILEATANGLAQLRSDFETASAVREEAASAFGYEGLAGAVEEFVDNWKHNRERQLETIDGVQKAIVDVAANYVEHDACAVNELNS
jgi:hypothetical protein